MGKTSKFFRAFVEGQTISDGRTIEAAWIDQIAETFSAENYSPRINVEHLAGFSPEPPFNGYGTVTAVEARDVELTFGGKTEKRRALYCQVEANDQLVDLVAKDQKPFPSVELTPDYAGTGKVGLIGLAFTDKPASVATEKLQFSRAVPGSLFSAGTDGVTIEFEVPAVDPAKLDGTIAGFFSALTAKLKGDPKTETPPAPPAPANDNFASFAADIQTAVTGAVTAAFKPLAEAQAKTDRDFAALVKKLEAEPETPNFSRKPATGGANALLTDC